MPRLVALGVLGVLLAPAAASAVTLPAVHYTAQLERTRTFLGITKKGDRFRAYVSDATARRATLSVWLRGDLGPDGHISAMSYGMGLEADLERREATGTVTLPDGRALGFTAESGFGGGLVERNYLHEGQRYRSGWIVLSDNRVRARTTITGTALDGSFETGPGIRPNPSCAQLGEDYEALSVQRGRLLHQSGIWELRLNRGRGSSAAYNRLGQAIGALDSLIFEVEKSYAACDSPSTGSLASAGPLSARNSVRISLNVTGRSAMGM